MQNEKKEERISIDKRDHRMISKNLDLYFFDQKIGQGLPALLTQWVEIRNQIDIFLKEKQKEYNFKEVITPVLGSKRLYEISGHMLHYKDDMFPEISRNNESFILRPMTCPHHCLVYSQKPRSYRELPLKICENSIIHRYESSGSLKGLERVRWMEMSDHHIFLRQEDLKKEFKANYNYISEVIKGFNLEISRLVCSISDAKKTDKYHSNKEKWEYSERLLADSLKELDLEFVTVEGEAAFYGPKLDIEVKTIDGKNVTLATIQLDLVTPEKFGLEYIDDKNKLNTPVLIHSSPIGTYQRFIALLLEQNNGKIPFWISPRQLIILPKNEKKSVLDFCQKLIEKLKCNGIRAEIFQKKTIGFRINDVYKKKVPYYLVVGEKELEGHGFSLINSYSNEEKKYSDFFEIIDMMKDKIREKK